MRTLILLALVGCGTSMATSPSHAIVWSDGHSDSPGVPAPVVCNDVVSHPCPWLLYTHTLVLVGDEATWTDASGGTNDIGRAAADYPDVVEMVPGMVFPDRGDDGGLRHTFTLQGHEADVTWTLFNVAGHTTFHLTVQP